MKIGLCGTMSVGKTTLVNALKELPEFKDYMFRTERSKELMAQGIPLNTDSTLKGQTVFLAERTGELMVENVITDRTVVDVMAFARASKSINSPDKDLFEDYAKRFIKEYDYIFYVSPVGVEIEDNGIRETNVDYRDLIDYTISKILDEQKHRIKNLNTLSGSTEKRIEQMLEALSS
jgi:GTPase SAR1 family protein